jgi:hypothetical protein
MVPSSLPMVAIHSKHKDINNLPTEATKRNLLLSQHQVMGNRK